MKNPKVSIIIPCFNDADYIEQSVQSALDQTFSNKEVIVVDDGSDSKTKKILQNLEPKIDELISQPNMGVSCARNNGIRAAKGEFILPIDSDDYFEPTFCEKAVSVFKKEKDVKLVTCEARWFLNDENFQIFKPRGGGITNFLTNSSALGNSMFLKKDWSKVGGYDEKMQKGWEDWEFFIRLHKGGGKTFVIPDILFNYRKRKSSRTSLANKNKFELLEYIFAKHSDIYKENFELFVKQLLHKLQKEEREKIKNTQRKEYKIGQAVLWPLRKIKRLF